MSIKATLSSDGVEELYTPPTLKKMCLYKCVTNTDILTKEMDVDEAMDGSQSEKLDWEKFRLKEPIQRELLEVVLDAGEKYLFKFTWKYAPLLAAIRMSQPDHLVKVHVSNTHTLHDCELEFLISGGSVKSLDINGCDSLTSDSLEAINKFGSNLVYLRIGDSKQILPEPFYCSQRSAFLRTPNLKTFIVSEVYCSVSEPNYWRFLVEGFISNLENLQITRSRYFETLEFLEPAKSKLTSLTLSYCSANDDVNAWASLFKLDKLRSLDLVHSSIRKVLVGENVVQRLLTALPNLTSLAVDPGLLKDIQVDTSNRGQGSKRLEFLGIMDNDEVEIRKAKLLANDVAHFGTIEGELNILEYYSNRIESDYYCNSWEYKYSSLKRLLESLSEVAGTPACKGVVVINLFIQTFKHNGVCDIHPELLSRILKKMLTADVVAKLGDVLRDQFIGAIFCLTKKWSYSDWFDVEYEPEIIRNVVDIMTILNGELDFDHYVYVTLVPRLMRMGEIAMFDWSVTLETYGMEDSKNFLRKAAQLLKKAVDRFPEEINALWGISSVLVIIKKLKGIIVYEAEEERNTIDLVEILSSMIASLRKLCLNSVSRRAAFHSAKGVDIVMALLKEIIDGRLGLADRDSFTLLAILKSILKDTKLKWKLSEAGMIASDLEKLLFSVHSKWQLWKSSNAGGDDTHCIKMKSIASMLKYVEKHPTFGYKSSAGVKEILIKLKKIVFHSFSHYDELE